MRALFRRRWGWFLVFCPLLFCFRATAATTARDVLFGNYYGILRNHTRHRDQLAKLEFLIPADGRKDSKISAILTLYFGDYRSMEYVPYQFLDVDYDEDKGSLTFDQDNLPLSFETDRFDGETLHAGVHNNWSGDDFELTMRRDRPLEPIYPLIEPISGDYVGTCGKTPAELQLYTSRTNRDAIRFGETFTVFDIMGQMGEMSGNGIGCGAAGMPTCLNEIITSGNYNFFREHLSLEGTQESYDCTVPANGQLDCGQCKLARVSDEMKNISLSISRAAPYFPPDSNWGAQPVAPGKYRGWLHHEYLDEFQAIELDVFPRPGHGKKPMTVIARLFFGDHDSPESLQYRGAAEVAFDPSTGRYSLFLPYKASQDAGLEIESDRNGVLRGRWHSYLFGGRVGTFEARSVEVGLPPLPKNAVTFGRVRGHYESSDWDLRLTTTTADVVDSPQDPFMPLSFGGDMRLSGMGTRRKVVDGGYDFYTGKISVIMSTGQVFVGRRLSRDQMWLSHILTSTSAFAPLPVFTPQPYRVYPLDEEEGRGHR